MFIAKYSYSVDSDSVLKALLNTSAVTKTCNFLIDVHFSNVCQIVVTNYAWFFKKRNASSIDIVHATFAKFEEYYL